MHFPPARLYVNGRPVGDLESVQLVPLPGEDRVRIPAETLSTIGGFMISPEIDDETAELLSGITADQLKELLTERI